MTFYTDTELAALLASSESDLVERKRSASDSNAIHRNICAFANDLPARGKPGVLFVGVEDDGTCSGIDVTDELLRKLAQMRSDGTIQPFPTMTVDQKTVDGCEMAVVQVMPATNPPLRYQGRAWIKGDRLSSKPAQRKSSVWSRGVLPDSDLSTCVRLLTHQSTTWI